MSNFQSLCFCITLMVHQFFPIILNAEEPAPWSNWRGPHRDGIVSSLPAKLPETPNILWRTKLASPALAGISATSQHVLVVDRDPLDKKDILHCLNATNGREIWNYSNLAPGNLDYGNSSRSTPIILADRVIFMGPFGHLAALDLKDGEEIWSLDLKEECNLKAKLSWGLCATPLIIGDKLFLYIGGKEIALIGINLKDGEISITSAGDPPSYGSLIHAKLGGKDQIIGADHETYGGWDPLTGKRLWKLEPLFSGEFLVPTPCIWKDHLILSGENNGTRIHSFNNKGEINPEPIATHELLAPDTHSPVVQGDKLLGVSGKLYCLDLNNKLKELWTLKDKSFEDHTSLIASPTQLLITNGSAEVLLLDTSKAQPTITSRYSLTPQSGEPESGLLSHPALVGNTLYLRLTKEILALKLN